MACFRLGRPGSLAGTPADPLPRARSSAKRRPGVPVHRIAPADASNAKVSSGGALVPSEPNSRIRCSMRFNSSCGSLRQPRAGLRAAIPRSTSLDVSRIQRSHNIVTQNIRQPAGHMNDAQQAQFHALARIVMAARDEAHLGRQSPALGQHAARFGVVRSEFLGFEIEHVQTALGGIARSLAHTPPDTPPANPAGQYRA